MRGRSDLILLSPTGSGKTLAYLLPLVSSLKKGVEGVQAVVLVPSRELALQIEQVFKAMATGFPVMSCYGGRPAMEEHRTMRGISPAVIIGTPGRMNDHLNWSSTSSTSVWSSAFRMRWPRSSESCRHCVAASCCRLPMRRRFRVLRA